MSILQDIKTAKLSSMKEKGNLRKTGADISLIEEENRKFSILNTLQAEVAIVGKNNGNRETTDKEAMSVIKKFKTNLEDLISEKVSRNPDEDMSNFKLELSIYESYLPKQMSENELSTAIDAILLDIDDEKSMKLMGKIMGILSSEYQGQYDGKLANTLVRKALNS